MSDPAALGAWRRRAEGRCDASRRPRVAVAAALAGVVAAGALLAGRAQTPPPTGAATTTTPSACAVVTAPLHADVDGDGCEEPVSFAGGVLTAGAVRMRVGGPDDHIALGRWTCASVMVALLRRATGEVFRFDGWATQANPVPAIAVGRVDGAADLRAAARPNGRCDDIVVTRTTGPPVLLPARPVAG